MAYIINNNYPCKLSQSKLFILENDLSGTLSNWL